MRYWLECYTKKYTTFGGRAGRREYWMYVLFNFLLYAGIVIVDELIGLNGLLGGLFSLWTLLPGWAVFTRRLHDTGRSGWWWLISLVPVIGTVVLIVFLCKKGQSGDNAYGPDPKGT